jgi:hypothetical protein
VRELFLTSISLGAVFCGAITYIGNGPNFMVKSIADSAGVVMPSFGGYVVWAVRHLIPVLALMVLVVIAPELPLKGLGLLLTAGWIAWQLRGARRASAPAPAA